MTAARRPSVQLAPPADGAGRRGSFLFGGRVAMAMPTADQFAEPAAAAGGLRGAGQLQGLSVGLGAPPGGRGGPPRREPRGRDKTVAVTPEQLAERVLAANGLRVGGRVWVPLGARYDEVFSFAEVLGMASQSSVSIAHPDGSVRSHPITDVLQTAKGDHPPDVCRLSVLNEATVLKCLQARRPQGLNLEPEPEPTPEPKPPTLPPTPSPGALPAQGAVHVDITHPRRSQPFRGAARPLRRSDAPQARLHRASS